MGPYEIVAPLGAGGMGEVYRARDTRLDRSVALKVLTSSLSASPELKARFEREARVISQLNHPNICTLHDIGHEHGTDFIVMELIDGESLAERLRKGPLPLNQIVRIGSEIADALDKAHRAGIAHRDLKPGNIMLTRSGAKLLDFGLAKPLGIAAKAGSAPLLSAALTSPNPQASPLTSAGTLIGTVQYMAPEQIEGKEADARTDIFALGAVLYEMATGARAFDGKTQISVASAILEKDPPPIPASQSDASGFFNDVVQTCLAKDPELRYASAHDVQLALQQVARTAVSVAKNPASGRILAVVLAAVCLVLTATAFVLWRNSRLPSMTVGPVRFAVPYPPAHVPEETASFNIAISGDGQHIAFTAYMGGATHLYVRNLNDDKLVEIPNTFDASAPFFSADSQWLIYRSETKLMKWPVSGGSAVMICGDCADRHLTGAVATADGDFILSTFTGLERVSANGVRHQFLAVDTAAHELALLTPFVLPDGHTLLYSSVLPDEVRLMALDLRNPKPRFLFDALGARYTSGHLLYGEHDAFWAVPFDAAKLRVTGPPFRLAEDVKFTASVPQFAVSDNGVLAYTRGSAGEIPRRILWLDRQGQETVVDTEPQNYFDQAIAPDGKRFVITYQTGKEQRIEVYDPARGGMLRFQPVSGSFQAPVWTPDGRDLVFTFFEAAGKWDLMRARADGANKPELVAHLPQQGWPTSISRNGIVSVMLSLGKGRIAVIPLVGSTEMQILHSTVLANEQQPAISPDGHWLAYVSDESGRNEVYVEPYPGPGAKLQASAAGGMRPRWSADGRQLFYNRQNAFYVVPVSSTPTLAVGKPLPLFEKEVDAGGAIGAFDVMPDGQHFLVTRELHPENKEIVVTIGWLEYLKRSNRTD